MNNVVILGYTNFKWLLVPLAKELKKKHGTKIHFVCTDAHSISYWKTQDREGIIDSFTTIGHFFSEYDQCTDEPDKMYRTARQNEERYQTLMVDILQTDRHLGRGFFAGGIGHPKSKLSNKASYPKSINFCNRAFAFWEKVFDEKSPDVIFGLTSAVLGKTCMAVARKRGIPVREFFQASYQAYHGWASDEFYTLVGFKEAFADLTDEEAQRLVTDEELIHLKRLPFADHYYTNFHKYTSWPLFLLHVWQQCVWYGLKTYRGRETIGNYFLLEKIRALYRMRKDLKRIMKFIMADIEEVKKKSFVFIPLQVEPESSVGMQSPEMGEQLACIEFLAKNLPADTYLVVKEHVPAIGRRPRDFYETIAEIPNVLFISPFAYAIDVARHARAVAVITSTLGMEAGVLGIPVISFGLHNNYNLLPHVHTIESWTALRPLLKVLFDENSSDGKKKRQADGRRYLAALKKVCIDFSWTDYASKDRAPASDKEVEVIYHSLVQSLKHLNIKT